MKKELSRLLEIIREKSYREGQFKLASGKMSPFYLDMKMTTLDPEGIFLVGEMFSDLIQENFSECRGVGGMSIGADPIATATTLSLFQKGLLVSTYLVRKESKSHGTEKYIEGLENMPKGASVVLVEDVITTGGSSLRAMEKLVDAGLKPIGLITIVDREEGARKVFESLGLKFYNLSTLSQVQNYDVS